MKSAKLPRCSAAARGWTMSTSKGWSRRWVLAAAATRKLTELCEKLPLNLNSAEHLRIPTWCSRSYATHLALVHPEQLEGLEPLEIEIPGPLTTQIQMREFNLEKPLFLSLQASNVALNTSRLKGFRGIRVNDGRNTVWTHPVPEGIDHAAAHRIFGTAEVLFSGGLSEFATTGRVRSSQNTRFPWPSTLQLTTS